MKFTKISIQSIEIFKKNKLINTIEKNDLSIDIKNI